jgi:hypothetical protein
VISCRSFRRELERALEGRARSGRLVELSFDAHLLACEDCRELLESEQALEILLASLPDPRLPDDLAERVLARLRHEREAGLDALLERAPAPNVPADLVRKVRAAVAEERAAAHTDPLDRLLELVPPPRIPATLAADVLAGVREATRPSRWRSLRPLWLSLAAAAALIALLFAVDRSRGERESVDEHIADPVVPSAGSEELPDEFLAAFDVLENWELVNGEDIDFLLASIDEIDEFVFEESAWSEAGAGGGSDDPK